MVGYRCRAAITGVRSWAGARYGAVIDAEDPRTPAPQTGFNKLRSLQGGRGSPPAPGLLIRCRDRVGHHGYVHRRRSFPGLLSDNLGGEKGSRKQQPQLGSRPRQARHYRPCGAVQNRGDLLIRQPLELAQQDYFAKIKR
jgi:hypothetical protein